MTGYYFPAIIKEAKNLSYLKNHYNSDDNVFNQTEFEIVLIYIGSSDCFASNIESLPISFNIIEDNLDIEVNSLGIQIHTIGISKGTNLLDELFHLANFSSFDEILIGNSWSNTGVLKYIYNDFQGPAITPQVVISFRKYRSISNNFEKYYRSIEYELVIERLIGNQEIDNFSIEASNIKNIIQNQLNLLR